MNTDFFLDAPSPFVLLDAARAHSSPPGLTAWHRCEGVPFWQVLEAAAQRRRPPCNSVWRGIFPAMPSCCPWSALRGLPGPCPARRDWTCG